MCAFIEIHLLSLLTELIRFKQQWPPINHFSKQEALSLNSPAFRWNSITTTRHKQRCALLPQPMWWGDVQTEGWSSPRSSLGNLLWAFVLQRWWWGYPSLVCVNVHALWTRHGRYEGVCLLLSRHTNASQQMGDILRTRETFKCN